MQFNPQISLKTALSNSWVVLKLIVPIYILADILFYYDILKHISFIFKPIVFTLGLPQEAALSIVSGMLLNLYAAIAFAAPLGLSAKEWTILAVFLGIAHSLLVETEIMKKLGIPRAYSIVLRISIGLLVGYLTSLLPENWFMHKVVENSQSPIQNQFSSFFDLLQNSFYASLSLSLQIIILVTILIFFLDFLKSRPFIHRHAQRVNSSFSIAVGIILGITYGAGILICEYEKGLLGKKEIFLIGTYLMICHAIIEDTLLFVIFGANIWMVVGLRIIFATLISYLVVLYFNKKTSESPVHKPH